MKAFFEAIWAGWVCKAVVGAFGGCKHVWEGLRVSTSPDNVVVGGVVGLVAARVLHAIPCLALVPTRRLWVAPYACATALDEVPFELEVGDVVVHKEHGHVGVVAERFAVSMMPDAWFQQHLGGLDSPMLQSPWYLVLVDDRCLGQQKRLVRCGCSGPKPLHRCRAVLEDAHNFFLNAPPPPQGPLSRYRQTAVDFPPPKKKLSR